MTQRILVLAALVAASSTLSAQSSVPGRILVANQQAGNASIVELATGAVTHVPVGTGPHEAAISADGKWGFVSIYGTAASVGNQIAVIDMATARVVRNIDLGTYTRPHGLIALGGSPTTLAITSETTQNVITVNAETGAMLTVVPTKGIGSHMLALAADGKRGFTANVGDGTMSAIDIGGGSMAVTIPIAPRAEGIAVTPDGRQVWVGSNETRTVSIVNTASMKIDTVLSGFGVPYRMAASPDGRSIAVVEAAANLVSVYDVATRALLGKIDVGGSPRGVVIGPDSRTAFVTLGPQNEVVVLDLSARKVLSRHAVGAAPDGVAYSARR